jgi:hypothetical protein
MLTQLNCFLLLATMTREEYKKLLAKENLYGEEVFVDHTRITTVKSRIISAASLALAAGLNPETIGMISNLAGGLVC